VEAIVLKTDGEIGQYSDENESLLFLQSIISNEAFGALNWVGKQKTDCIQALGKPTKQLLNTSVYTSKNRALILQFAEDSIVSAFKYYPNWNGANFENQNLKW